MGGCQSIISEIGWVWYKQLSQFALQKILVIHHRIATN